MTYKFLPHTADVKILVEADTLESAFKDAGSALKEVISGKIKIKELVEKEFEVSGKDLGALLYNFLEEFLFLLDAEDFLLSRVKKLKFEENNKKLKVVATGDNASDYGFSNDVKAITYNDMFVREGGGKIEMQFVLDV